MGRLNGLLLGLALGAGAFWLKDVKQPKIHLESETSSISQLEKEVNDFFQLSEENYPDIVKVSSDSSRLSFRKAYVLGELGKHQESLELYSSLVRDEVNYEPQLLSGRMFMNAEWLELHTSLKGKNEGTQKQGFLRCIELCPLNPIAYQKFSLILRGEENFKESIKYAKKALKLMPQDPDYHLNIALAYLNIGYVKKADQDSFIDSFSPRGDLKKAFYHLQVSYLLRKGNLPNQAAVKDDLSEKPSFMLRIMDKMYGIN